MSRRSRKDVDDLLADLDNLGTEQPTKPPRKSADKSASSTAASNDASAASKKAPEDAQSLLDDLDSLVQSRAASSSRASHRKKDEATSTPTPAASSPVPEAKASKVEPSQPQPATQMSTAASATESTAPEQPTDSASSSTGGGWAGWGSSLFSQATKLADQARQEFEKRAPTQAEQARAVGNKGWDLAKNVRGFVKEAGLEKWGEEVTKVGKRGWTDIVNAVAPPIAAHEIIQVTLSHDMVGYDGISDVTYQVLAKVMEQVDSSGIEQKLIVNKAQIETPASKPKSGPSDEQERNLNAVEGFAAAFRLAKVNLDECTKQHEVAAPPPKTAESAALPITTCPVFVRIQACLADLPGETLESGSESAKFLFFLVLLRDPQHGLSHKTVSQAVPTPWLDVPFEENQWVEESLVDVLSNALSVIGQDYVQGRMSGRTKSSKEGLAASAPDAEKSAEALT